MENLVAAKILLTGTINSALKRDEKTMPEIIASCRTMAQTCDVDVGDLKRISMMRLVDMIEAEPTCKRVEVTTMGEEKTEVCANAA